jgi:hypothetical protein
MLLIVIWICLQRLAGSEEILPIPDTSSPYTFRVPKEVESSIQASLEKVFLSLLLKCSFKFMFSFFLWTSFTFLLPFFQIAIKDYNPLEHERGFHAKLNGLVKESLQFR